MEIIFDYLSARYFRADIHELAIKERELNLRLAYDWLNNKWKKTQITYNDLMFELFDAPSIQVGYSIKFNMPIELELFEQMSEDGRQICIMKINEFKEQEARQ